MDPCAEPLITSMDRVHRAHPERAARLCWFWPDGLGPGRTAVFGGPHSVFWQLHHRARSGVSCPVLAVACLDASTTPPTMNQRSRGSCCVAGHTRPHLGYAGRRTGQESVTGHRWLTGVPNLPGTAGWAGPPGSGSGGQMRYEADVQGGQQRGMVGGPGVEHADHRPVCRALLGPGVGEDPSAIHRRLRAAGRRSTPATRYVVQSPVEGCVERLDVAA
jgi:hypothetical protein